MDNQILLYWRKEYNISPDGSLRSFIRGYFKDQPAIMIKPAPDTNGLKEAKSFYKIGIHLLKQQINVPQIYYFDKKRGIIIVEDLGDILLENIVSSNKRLWDNKLTALYERAITQLLKFQFIGANNFDYNWCFDTAKYDSNFALKREGFYFLEYLIEKFFDIHITQYIKQEIVELFSSLDKINVYYGLMHRDFQSRNLIFHKIKNKIYIIDFQGARYGPICYDLASILQDPYVMMPTEMVDKLKRFYIKNLKGYIQISEDEFDYQFKLLSVFRLMQALGAFAKLSLELKKTWFKKHVASAIKRLNYCLSYEEFNKYKKLQDLIKKLNNICEDI